MDGPIPQLNRPAFSKPLFASRNSEGQHSSNQNEQPFKSTSPRPTFGASDRANSGQRAGRGGPRTLTEAFEATAQEADYSGHYLWSHGRKDYQGSSIPRPQLNAADLRKDSPSPSRPRDPQSRLPRSTDARRGSSAESPHLQPRRSPFGLKEAFERVSRSEDSADAAHTPGGPEKVGSPGVLSSRSKDSQTDRSRFRGSTKIDGTPRSTSPASFTRTRKSTPSPDAELVGSEPVDEGGTRPDESMVLGSGSDYSGRLHRPDMTKDSFQQELVKHARDQERVKGALSKGNGVFAKARRRESPVSAESLEAGAAIKRSWLRNFDEPRHEGSVSSEGSDPPVQLPRTWGSKARSRKDFLSRIPQPDDKAKQQLVHGPKSPTLDMGDWLDAAARVPLPSVEDTPSELEDASKLSPPRTLSYQSPDKIRAWEDDDFTARSLHISASPPSKPKRSILLDQIREREIGALKDRAVTTSRLGEIKKRTSIDSLRSQDDTEEAFNSSPEKKIINDIRTPLRSTRSGSLIGRSGRKQSGDAENQLPTTYENEGQPIPDTPVVVYKGSRSRNASAVAEEPTDGQRNNSAERRPKLLHQDSHEILRQLARATSSSPASASRPIKEKSVESRSKDVPSRPQSSSDRSRPKTAESSWQDVHKEFDIDDLLATDDDTKPDWSRQIESELSASRLRAASFGKSQHARRFSSEDEDKENRNVDSTPQPRRVPLAAINPTPRVTGAWVDTPVITKSTKVDPPTKQPRQFPFGIGRIFSGTKTEKTEPLPSQPVQRENVLPEPTSALLENLKPHIPPHSAKSIPPEDDFTIDSIQEMLQADASLTAMSDTSAFDIANAALAANAASRPQHLSDAERRRKDEELRAEKISKILKRTQSGLHETEQRIEGVKSRLEKGWRELSAGESARRVFSRGIRSWVLDDEWHLTTLGLMILITGLLWALEWTACYNYCHESYSLSSGNGAADAPLFGWATLYFLQQYLPWIFNPLVIVLRFFASRMDLVWDFTLDVLDLPSERLDWGQGFGYGAQHRRVWKLYEIEMRRRRRGR